MMKKQVVKHDEENKDMSSMLFAKSMMSIEGIND
jgi:hypothetical protein